MGMDPQRVFEEANAVCGRTIAEPRHPKEAVRPQKAAAAAAQAEHQRPD